MRILGETILEVYKKSEESSEYVTLREGIDKYGAAEFYDMMHGENDDYVVIDTEALKNEN